jgi:hypothetical protein
MGVTRKSHAWRERAIVVIGRLAGSRKQSPTRIAAGKGSVQHSRPSNGSACARTAPSPSARRRRSASRRGPPARDDVIRQDQPGRHAVLVSSPAPHSGRPRNGACKHKLTPVAASGSGGGTNCAGKKWVGTSSAIAIGVGGTSRGGRAACGRARARVKPRLTLSSTVTCAGSSGLSSTVVGATAVLCPQT